MKGLLQFKLAFLILLYPELLLLSALPLFVIQFSVMYLNEVFYKLDTLISQNSNILILQNKPITQPC